MPARLAVAVLSLVLLLPAFSSSVSAQRRQRNYPPQMEGFRAEVYKRVGDVELKMYICEPQGRPARPRAAIVFFFGGGWKSGTPQQFEQQCRRLAQRGVVAMTADYRVRNRHETKAKECVADGKSAIRWVRQNAKRLGIDPERIAAGGGSAGGHVAACTGILPHGDEPGEDADISSRPNLMVLFNPALVLAPVAGQNFLKQDVLATLADRMGVEPKKLSPYHHIAPKAPPTLIFHGKADETVNYRGVELFTKAMTEAGNACVLSGFDDAGHGFFNYGRDGNAAFGETVRQMDKFLVKHGFAEPAK